MSIRIVLADDHAMIRDGLRAILNSDANIQVVGESSNGREAVQQARDLKPDLIVMDMGMPELNGAQATRQILADNAQIKVIALSTYTQKQFVTPMLEAGAVAYVCKAAASDELLKAIAAVLRGEKYYCPQIADLVVNDGGKSDSATKSSTKTSLSDREREILQHVAEGKTSLEIGAVLRISSKTVETHRRNIMLKLQLHTVADLTKYALREGLTSG